MMNNLEEPFPYHTIILETYQFDHMLWPKSINKDKINYVRKCTFTFFDVLLCLLVVIIIFFIVVDFVIH